MNSSIAVRLRPVVLPDDVATAVAWYQDPEVLAGSEGPEASPFPPERVARMYQYLAQIGEVFIIEVNDRGAWIPVGDAALSERMMPIVVGDARWRGRGIGRAALGALIGHAKSAGCRRLTAHKIYETNTASQRLFAGAGFRLVDRGQEDNGLRYGVWALDLG